MVAAGAVSVRETYHFGNLATTASLSFCCFYNTYCIVGANAKLIFQNSRNDGGSARCERGQLHVHETWISVVVVSRRRSPFQKFIQPCCES